MAIWDNGKIINTTLPEKDFYTLEEAAKIAGCEPGHIINFGCLGELGFVMHIPPWVSLYPVYKADCYSGNDNIAISTLARESFITTQAGKEKIIKRAPLANSGNEMLYLNSMSSIEYLSFYSDCSYNQHFFDQCYSFSQRKPIKLMCNTASDFLGWIPVVKGEFYGIKVTVFDLHVMHVDLMNLIQTKKKPWETAEERRARMEKRQRKKSRIAVVVERKPIIFKASDQLTEKMPEVEVSQQQDIVAVVENEVALVIPPAKELDKVVAEGKDAVATIPRHVVAAKEDTVVISQPVNQPSVQSGDFLLRLEGVKTRIGLSKSMIYNKLNLKHKQYDESFPKQKSLGDSAVAWLDSEITAWIENRVIASRMNPPAAKKRKALSAKKIVE